LVVVVLVVVGVLLAWQTNQIRIAE